MKLRNILMKEQSGTHLKDVPKVMSNFSTFGIGAATTAVTVSEKLSNF